MINDSRHFIRRPRVWRSARKANHGATVRKPSKTRQSFRPPVPQAHPQANMLPRNSRKECRSNSAHASFERARRTCPKASQKAEARAEGRWRGHTNRRHPSYVQVPIRLRAVRRMSLHCFLLYVSCRTRPPAICYQSARCVRLLHVVLLADRKTTPDVTFIFFVNAPEISLCAQFKLPNVELDHSHHS